MNMQDYLDDAVAQFKDTNDGIDYLSIGIEYGHSGKMEYRCSMSFKVDDSKGELAHVHNCRSLGAALFECYRRAMFNWEQGAKT